MQRQISGCTWPSFGHPNDWRQLACTFLLQTLLLLLIPGAWTLLPHRYTLTLWDLCKPCTDFSSQCISTCWIRCGGQGFGLSACLFVLEKSLCDQCWCDVSVYFCIAPLGAALCCLRPVCELHLSPLLTIHTDGAEGFGCFVSHQQMQDTTHTLTHIHTYTQISWSWNTTSLSVVPFLFFVYFILCCSEIECFFFFLFLQAATQTFLPYFGFLFKSSCLHCTKYSFWNMFYSYKVFGFF